MSVRKSNCTNGVVGGSGIRMRSGEMRKVNVFEIKCLGGVTRMDRFRNVEVRRRAVKEKELASSCSESVEMVWIRGENG